MKYVGSNEPLFGHQNNHNFNPEVVIRREEPKPIVPTTPIFKTQDIPIVEYTGSVNLGYIEPTIVSDHTLTNHELIANTSAFKRTVVNCTGQDINILYRNGICQLLKHNDRLSKYHGDLLVIDNYTKSRVDIEEQLMHMTQRASKLVDVSSNYTKAYTKAIIGVMGVDTGNYINFNVTSRISLSSLKDHTGQVKETYIPMLDVMLGDMDSTLIHPFGDTRSAAVKIKELNLHNNSILVGVDLVDKSNHCEPRYYHALGKVHKIVPRVDSQKQDGVYVTYYRPKVMDDGTYDYITEIEYEPLISADNKFGLYKTVEAAMAGGNLSDKQNIELTAIKLELQKAEQEAKRIQQQHDFDMQRQKQKMDQLDYEFKTEELKLKREIQILQQQLTTNKHNHELVKVEHDTKQLEVREKIVEKENAFSMFKNNIGLVMVLFEVYRSWSEHKQKAKELELNRKKETLKTTGVVIGALATIFSVVNKFVGVTKKASGLLSLI